MKVTISGGAVQPTIEVSGGDSAVKIIRPKNQIVDLVDYPNVTVVGGIESILVPANSPLKFDFDYQIGSPFNPISGGIMFDLSGANVGSASSVFHLDSVAPTFGNNIPTVLIGFTLSDYALNELNEFVFHYMEDPQNNNEPYLKIYHIKNITT
jgi:hypothetical protein